MTHTIKVWLYPGANPNLSPTSWGLYEQDISAYVRRPGQDGGAAINYSWGKQDESTNTDAGSMTLTLDNRDGRFSTEKIDGPWYGLLDINTPIRLGVVAGTDTFTRTVSGALGAAAGWAGGWQNATAAPATTTYSVDGSKGLVNLPSANTFSVALLSDASARDVDIVSVINPVVAASGASYAMGHAVRFTDFSNFVYSTLEFNVAGDVTVKIRRAYGGSFTDLTALNPIPSTSYTPGQTWNLRTQMDGDTMRVKAWPSSGSEPAAWHISAADEDNNGTGVGVYSTRFLGNNNGAVNFVGLDSITVTGLEWTGYVASWPLRWDITGSNSWAPITASGILRRLRQGTAVTQSPLLRQLSGTADSYGYWPLEDGADAKYFIAASPNTAPATMVDVTPASESSLPGASVAPTMDSATSSIVAQTKKVPTGFALIGYTGFAAMVVFKLSSVPSTKTRIIRVRCSRGPVGFYDFSVDSTNIYVDMYDATAGFISTTTNAAPFNMSGVWIAWQLETEVVGTNTNWSAVMHKVTTNAPFYTQSGSNPGFGFSFVAQMELGGVSGAAYSHIWLGKNTLPFLDSNFANVVGGWDGEPAATRFARICGEAGIPYSIAGPSSAVATTEKMGPQKEAATLASLQACVDADYGVMTERGAGLEMIPRQTRWNLSQIMTLVMESGHIADPPQPTRDDQRLRNKWTISRSGGGSATVQSDASVARNGEAADSATLNVYDDSVLENHAAWRVSLGTQIRARWPSISINLTRNPSLAEYWRRRFYGWRFGVLTALAQVKGNEPDLIMEGYQATLSPEMWTVDMNATDARVWTAAVTDDTGIYGRADNEYCTTTALISATALTIPITTGTVSGLNMPKWDTTAGLWSGGVDFNIGGERVIVTSITNGAGQAQTLNASARGVGGYAASHASGSSVSLWSPATVAL